MKNITMKLLIIGLVLTAFLIAVAAKADFATDIANIGQDLSGTNAAVVAFGGKSLSKSDTYCAGALYTYNITPQGGAAVVGGIDRLFTTGGGGFNKQSDTFTLSGGFQLSTLIHPFSMWGATNFALRTGAATLIGTPTSGQNGGNIMNLNRVFAYTDLYTFRMPAFKVPATICLGGAYGNRTGAGSQFDGNWADVFLGLHAGDGGASMTSANLDDQKIAETANARF